MDDRDDNLEDKMDLSALMPSPDRLELMAQGVVARATARVDLAPLLPSADHLEKMAQEVVSRVTVRRTRMRDALPRQVLRWSAPLLAAGVGLAACLWMVGVSPNDTTDPTSVVTQWAMSNEAPTAKNIFDTLGSEDSQ